MNKETLIFIIVCIFGLLFVMTIYHDEYMNISGTVDTTNPANAPRLSDLFPDRAEGPHQKFSTKENCLRCHQTGVEIPGMGKAPKIGHEIRENCTSCHKLPAS